MPHAKVRHRRRAQARPAVGQARGAGRSQRMSGPRTARTPDWSSRAVSR